MNDDFNPAQPEGSPPKRKLKRHFFLAVLGIALLLILLGQILGDAALGILSGFLSAVFGPLSGGVSFLFMYLTFIGIDFLVLLYCGLCEKPTFRSFAWAGRGGQRGNTWKNFFLGLLIGFGMNGLCVLLAWLHGDLDLSVGRFEAFYLLCALLCVCVQSAAEELVTRGYMMSALRERYKAWAAIAVNSLFFGCLHLLNPGVTALSVLQIVFVGLLLSLIVYYLDSLWMCIAIHTAWNFTQNFLFGLPNSGIVSESSFLHLEGAASSLFYDAAFGVEGGLTGSVLMGLMSAGLILYGARRKKASGQATL